MNTTVTQQGLEDFSLVQSRTRQRRGSRGPHSPSQSQHGAVLAGRLQGGSERKVAGTQPVPCKFFKAGTCTAGRSCQFAHIRTSGLTNSPHGSSSASGVTICKYFLQGRCKFGERCALSHAKPSFWDDDSSMNQTHSPYMSSTLHSGSESSSSLQMNTSLNSLHKSVNLIEEPVIHVSGIGASPHQRRLSETSTDGYAISGNQSPTPVRGNSAVFDPFARHSTSRQESNHLRDAVLEEEETENGLESEPNYRRRYRASISKDTYGSPYTITELNLTAEDEGLYDSKGHLSTSATSPSSLAILAGNRQRLSSSKSKSSMDFPSVSTGSFSMGNKLDNDMVRQLFDAASPSKAPGIERKSSMVNSDRLLSSSLLGGPNSLALPDLKEHHLQFREIVDEPAKKDSHVSFGEVDSALGGSQDSNERDKHISPLLREDRDHSLRRETLGDGSLLASQLLEGGPSRSSEHFTTGVETSGEPQQVNTTDHGVDDDPKEKLGRGGLTSEPIQIINSDSHANISSSFPKYASPFAFGLDFPNSMQRGRLLHEMEAKKIEEEKLTDEDVDEDVVEKVSRLPSSLSDLLTPHEQIQMTLNSRRESLRGSSSFGDHSSSFLGPRHQAQDFTIMEHDDMEPHHSHHPHLRDKDAEGRDGMLSRGSYSRRLSEQMGSQTGEYLSGGSREVFSSHSKEAGISMNSRRRFSGMGPDSLLSRSLDRYRRNSVNDNGGDMNLLQSGRYSHSRASASESLQLGVSPREQFGHREMQLPDASLSNHSDFVNGNLSQKWQHENEMFAHLGPHEISDDMDSGDKRFDGRLTNTYDSQAALFSRASSGRRLSASSGISASYGQSASSRDKRSAGYAAAVKSSIRGSPTAGRDDSSANFDPSIYLLGGPHPRANEPLCPFAIGGKCRYGEYCRYLHGLMCPSCKREILHPYRPEEHEPHITTCQARKRQEEQQNLNSEDIECGICYEKVMSKKDARFGLLNCNHSFCLTCIRNWRAQSSMESAVIRSCPICRIPSYFITPSAEWIADPVEKRRVIDEYKKKLRAIPCKYFNYGQGSCPFGTSCFYSHVFKDGSREEVRLRKCVTGDEEVRIVSAVKLSDFLDFD